MEACKGKIASISNEVSFSYARISNAWGDAHPSVKLSPITDRATCDEKNGQQWIIYHQVGDPNIVYYIFVTFQESGFFRKSYELIFSAGYVVQGFQISIKHDFLTVHYPLKKKEEGSLDQIMKSLYESLMGG